MCIRDSNGSSQASCFVFLIVPRFSKLFLHIILKQSLQFLFVFFSQSDTVEVPTCNSAAIFFKGSPLSIRLIASNFLSIETTTFFRFDAISYTLHYTIHYTSNKKKSGVSVLESVRLTTHRHINSGRCHLTIWEVQ